jgi:hypothetical protein
MAFFSPHALRGFSFEEIRLSATHGQPGTTIEQPSGLPTIIAIMPFLNQMIENMTVVDNDLGIAITGIANPAYLTPCCFRKGTYFLSVPLI